MSITVAGVTITGIADADAMSAKQLLAVYNELTGKKTSKFSSRAKGLKQVKAELRNALDTGHSKSNGAEKPVAKAAPAKPAAKAKATRSRGGFDYPADAKVQGHREGTKRAKVIELLGRPEGATLEEVQKAVGWDAKTAYDGVRLLHTYLGYGLKTSAEGRIHLVRPK